MWYQDSDVIDPSHEETEEEEWGEEEEIEEEEESVPSTEEEWTEEMYKRKAPLWRGLSKLPQEIKSEEDLPPDPEVLSSTTEDEAPSKPRKPRKKFFEDPKFYFQKNKPELPVDQWDEEENLDNIETLMKQTTERNELDAAVMTGVLTHLVPNFGFDDVAYKEVISRPASSADSNYDLVLSSSDEEKITPLGKDHYKELVLADERLIDCHSGRKVCDKMYPTKYYGLAKILERKEKVKNLKNPANKSTLSSYMTVLNSSDGSSFCPSASVRKKGWKLKEPFPKKDSMEKNVSSSSNIEIGSESDRKLDESRPGPSKVYPKCKWFDECLFKLLFKLAVKREKKISTIKTELDFEIDEILDELFMMSRDARNHLIPKVTDDFIIYKNEFMKHFDQDRQETKQTDTEEIKLWPDPMEKAVQMDVGGELDDTSREDRPLTKEERNVSPRLYKKIPRRFTPRARVEARLAEERALDVKKKKGIIQKKFKPIEINLEALPQAMEDYYKEKEEHKRKKEKDLKPKDDDTIMFKKKHEGKHEVKPAGSAVSLFPSYTKLIPPYSNVCKERIRKTLKKYRKAFNNELQSLADQETFALAGVALKRMYVITIGKGKPPVSLNYNDQARLYRILEK